MITLRRIATLAAASAVLALTACSGGGETNEGTIETNVTNVAEPVNTVVENVVIETPVVTNAAPVPAARGEDFTDTEQTKDDADATGMTSRVDRSADEAPTEPAK
ncbi:hypothetical protein P1X14_20535 [Sphingomonas sp. AOB5]|uniref:hypothetical protein n=1 Tax=Sphingomonas sp. AOB5 TaxID=3034017 RepID=UPI0023F74067|nr:hypothetical protein [Sphingomonas sp. AOB5]MDF7777654.1 hypothetical protein [Sphingomonas sp. AOB5]